MSGGIVASRIQALSPTRETAGWSMNIVFDIGYDIKGRKPGNKLALNYRFKETVSAEITEIPANEAPVAVVWTARKVLEQRWKLYDADLTCGDVNSKMLTRWHAGRHWLRLVEGNCGKASATSDSRELTTEVVTRATEQYSAGTLRMLGLNKYVPRSAKENPNPTGVFEHVAHDERDEVMEAVSAISDNFISVEGVLHVACAQPAIRVSDSGKIRSRRQFEENLAVETRSRYLDGHGGCLMGMIAYPLGDWDTVRTRLYDQAIDSGAKAPETHLSKPEVHLPESLNADIDARRAVDTLVKKTMYAVQFLPNYDRREVREFFNAQSNQRLELLEAMLGGPAVTLSRAVGTELLRRVAEIEDGMSVDVHLSAADMRLGF
jgi:hypothetical protein